MEARKAGEIKRQPRSKKRPPDREKVEERGTGMWDERVRGCTTRFARWLEPQTVTERNRREWERMVESNDQ